MMQESLTDRLAHVNDVREHSPLHPTENTEVQHYGSIAAKRHAKALQKAKASASKTVVGSCSTPQTILEMGAEQFENQN